MSIPKVADVTKADALNYIVDAIQKANYALKNVNAKVASTIPKVKILWDQVQLLQIYIILI